MPKTIPKKRRRYEHSAYSNLSATTNLRFEAETPSVIHNAFAHPGNVLCRSVRSVTQNGQRRRVCGSLTHAIHTCNSSREKEARHQFLDHNVSSTTYLRMNHIVKILPCQLQMPVTKSQVNSWLTVLDMLQSTADSTHILHSTTDTTHKIFKHSDPEVSL